MNFSQISDLNNGDKWKKMKSSLDGVSRHLIHMRREERVK